MNKLNGQGMKHIQTLVINTTFLGMINMIPGYKRAASFLDEQIAKGMREPLVAKDCMELDAVGVFEQAKADSVQVQDLLAVLGSLSKDVYTFGARDGDKPLSHEETLHRMATFDEDMRDPVKVQGLLNFRTVLRFNASALNAEV